MEVPEQNESSDKEDEGIKEEEEAQVVESGDGLERQEEEEEEESSDLEEDYRKMNRFANGFRAALHFDDEDSDDEEND